MARITAIEEVPITSLAIGSGQVRVRRVDDAIDSLVESIRLHGLLEPIMVCPDAKAGRFEVLLGQRRVMAHERLGREKILAAIVDEPVDHTTAKVLSLTENLIRRDLESRDLIDACTALYKKYGSARAVAEETGLPYSQVLRHIKYDRLEAPLRQPVDAGEIKLDIALKAQDAVTLDGNVDVAEATELAEAMSGMNGRARRQIMQAKLHDPRKPVETLLKEFRASHKTRDVTVTLSEDLHGAVDAYAKRAKVSHGEAVARLVAQALARSDGATPVRHR